MIDHRARSSLVIREARDRDIADVARIYAHHVLHGLASFEEVPPSADEMARRRAFVLSQHLPFLVAETPAGVAGYCYATEYRPRAAYRYTVENSVYVADGQQGRGIGRALLEELVARCARGPWRQMLAVIGNSGNSASLALHRSVGFEHVGTLTAVGFKFGCWVDSVLMQRPLGAGYATPPDEARER